jgi:hypothetical protein
MITCVDYKSIWELHDQLMFVPRAYDNQPVLFDCVGICGVYGKVECEDRQRLIWLNWTFGSLNPICEVQIHSSPLA